MTLDYGKYGRFLIIYGYCRVDIINRILGFNTFALEEQGLSGSIIGVEGKLRVVSGYLRGLGFLVFRLRFSRLGC